MAQNRVPDSSGGKLGNFILKEFSGRILYSTILTINILMGQIFLTFHHYCLDAVLGHNQQVWLGVTRWDSSLATLDFRRRTQGARGGRGRKTHVQGKNVGARRQHACKRRVVLNIRLERRGRDERAVASRYITLLVN